MHEYQCQQYTQQVYSEHDGNLWNILLVCPRRHQDEDIDLTTKPSRHNQIVSLLTEIDETNLDSTTLFTKSKVLDTSNDDKEDDIYPPLGYYMRYQNPV